MFAVPDWDAAIIAALALASGPTASVSTRIGKPLKEEVAARDEVPCGLGDSVRTKFLQGLSRNRLLALFGVAGVFGLEDFLFRDFLPNWHMEGFVQTAFF